MKSILKYSNKYDKRVKKVKPMFVEKIRFSQISALSFVFCQIKFPGITKQDRDANKKNNAWVKKVIT